MAAGFRRLQTSGGRRSRGRRCKCEDDDHASSKWLPSTFQVPSPGSLPRHPGWVLSPMLQVVKRRGSERSLPRVTCWVRQSWQWLELPCGPGLHHHLLPTTCTQPVPPPGSQKPHRTHGYVLTPSTLPEAGIRAWQRYWSGRYWVARLPLVFPALSTCQPLNQGLANRISVACQPT